MTIIGMKVGQYIIVLKGHDSVPKGTVLRVTSVSSALVGTTFVTQLGSKERCSFFKGDRLNVKNDSSYIEVITRDHLKDLYKDLLKDVTDKIEVLEAEAEDFTKRIKWCSKYKTDEEGMADEVMQAIDGKKTKEEIKEALTTVFKGKVSSSSIDKFFPANGDSQPMERY